jgi:hypothetical protein
MKIQHNKNMTNTLVDCSSNAEFEAIQKDRWFKYKETTIHFQDCGLVDPRRIELIKVGSEGMTVGEVFAMLQQQTDYIPLNRCISDFISKTPRDESLADLLPQCTAHRDLFFFGSTFENWRGEKWVLSINYSLIGAPISYLKRHLKEGWYPRKWRVAVIRK